MEQARRLVLIRHAKAAEGNVDRERPLAKRGMNEAPEIGRWLAERQLVPDRVVVSPALRARQTWERATTGLDGAVDAVQDERVEPVDVVSSETRTDDAGPDDAEQGKERS